ncbi:CIA30 family protein [bacterium]|nr:CIA30 family protein [bacterium]|tara:strand:+ start:3780 stop:4595 length:816 start_codon:yes stop_codon:yes gene_type:complete
MISRILPPSAREAAREIEYFGGSPLQQVLPWVPKPRADSPGRPFVNDPENQLVLFDFTSTSPDSNPETFGKTFGALNDVVMGGQSEASVSLVKVPKQDGGCVAKLSGVVEGDNGGFASMRSRDFQPSVDLGDYYGLRLTVKGDGRRYKLIARDVVDFFGLAWHCGFDTTEGEWLEIDVPFTELTPVLRADVLRPDSSEWRTFRRDQLRSLQIMLSKYELGMKELNTTFASGPFSLELKSIRAYKEERDPIVKKGREIVKSLKSGDSDNNAR